MMTFASFYWDPNPVVFTVPWLNLPILWYGVLFAAGFMIGFLIFIGILERFFLCRPELQEDEIVGEWNVSRFSEAASRGKGPLVRALNDWLISDEQEEVKLSRKEALFASCTPYPQRALRRLKLEKICPRILLSLRKQAVFLADRLTVYMVVATIIGARLGHYLFYESPSEYLEHPWEILQIWKGGLASHGAVIAIVIALWVFMLRYKAKGRQLTWLYLLDFVCVPAALAGALIRVGNFFNQEILGTVTDVPWAVVLGHPVDRSLPVPRHPVQLYEAFFYAVVFIFLFRLSLRWKYFTREGRLLGLFLTSVFGFRLFVEYWKEEQSFLFSGSLTMGQILSIPALLIGIFLLLRRHTRSLSRY